MSFDRRQFLRASLYSSLLYGAGSLPKMVNEANAEFVNLSNNMLVNLMLDGGPDMRHLIAPEWSSNSQSVGYKYWKNRWRSHGLPNNNNATLQARWQNDYYPITVGGSGWTTNGSDNNVLNDDSGDSVANGNNESRSNTGVTFGIWRQAGWLIDMFLEGNVAIVANAVGGRNRDHSHSTIMMEQGNLAAGANQLEHSGWGGRLAQQAGGKPVALTDIPRSFCFGAGNSIDKIDNSDLVSIQNSRQLGLYGFDAGLDIRYERRQQMAISLRGYYAALRQESFNTDAYEKVMDHESKVRLFGELINNRLDFAEPALIRALYSNSQTDDYPPVPTGINLDTNGASRKVLNSYSFGRQIRNLYDVIASNDLLDLRVASLDYGGWDTHENQRPNVNQTDLDDPEINRGIESNFKDIFGGPGGSQYSMPGALHGGFSALWQNLDVADKNKIVINVAGEFGRQIRDNGDNGTDHGKGNYMLLIGDSVRGGIYGKLFPEAEIAKLDDDNISTPDIDPLTDFDHVFGAACDWVASGSGGAVFPGRGSNSNVEDDVTPANLFT